MYLQPICEVTGSETIRSSTLMPSLFHYVVFEFLCSNLAFYAYINVMCMLWCTLDIVRSVELSIVLLTTSRIFY